MILNVNFFDTVKDMELLHIELDENPDFSYLGSYGSIDEIIEEFEYQGFKESELINLTNNQYGHIVEIIKSSETCFHVFVGSR